MVQTRSKDGPSPDQTGSGTGQTAGTHPAEAKTSLRDNLESFVITMLLVLVVRQMVVEAFKIPTGSMAPTLLGVHKEVRCPNCGWVFTVGHDKLRDGMVQCPNDLYTWSEAADFYGDQPDDTIRFRHPAWLWHEGRSMGTGQKVMGTDAANRVNRYGSRIFVNKFIYKLRKPRRWEVVVFLYPYDEAHKSYIKRLVGFPGERIAIRNGDVYADGQIARKAPAVQDGLWQHVHDSRYVPLREVVPTWDFRRAAHAWYRDDKDGSLTLNALGSDTPVLAAFARPIKNLNPYNGGGRTPASMQARSGGHEVGDSRIEALLTVQSRRQVPQAAVALRIVEDEHDFTLSVPVGEAGKAVLTDGGRPVAERLVEGLRPGEKTRLVLENYDDLVVAKLRGETIISHPYEGNPRPSLRRKRIEFGAAAARVVYNRIKIQRDIYYIEPGESLDEPYTYELDEESYFVLGDNSAQSSDSRRWPSPGVPQDHLLGLAFGVFWPIHDMKLLSSRPW